uniref:Uncharacterized protein n=1 Tax=Anguilla anguilla TaxID=7936 RepID=A0A0E9WIC3_ANGAN
MRHLKHKRSVQCTTKNKDALQQVWCYSRRCFLREGN